MKSVKWTVWAATALVFVATEVLAAERCGERFVDALAACRPAECQFTHPLTGETMTQRVIGPDGDVCQYVQQMPNGGIMKCRYNEATRKQLAAYLRHLADAETVGASAHTDFATGETTSEHRLDGKPVRNPLAEALASGQCRISGYGQ